METATIKNVMPKPGAPQFTEGTKGSTADKPLPPVDEKTRDEIPVTTHGTPKGNETPVTPMSTAELRKE